MKSLLKGFAFICFAYGRWKSGTALAQEKCCERMLSIRS